MDTSRLQSLLDTTIHALGVMSDDGGSIAFQNGLESYGTRAIPFFSSVEILAVSVDTSREYLSMPARGFFELTAGSHLVLNPRSPDRQEFTPEQIQHALRPALVLTPPTEKASVLGKLSSRFLRN
jgi:SseB protein N-terminal domain